ncbi:damage-control phosphatase ARMT1 family protein [Kitasatospora sp. NBC_00240]|uniref:damage-control phosphatase ARMT1 family protein n=1 Tax=Kitasatospora sp. NBC_00240 TaxID=2903567 RepID=UPI00224FA880|nr:damage-control phosphatase ARMT1 family protein [Kitasatospora sp. NBC_00240]MCX5208057.1 damage-control phosphatase ARMT1 family protein [Kitasatospora sp. NBC_00240]
MSPAPTIRSDVPGSFPWSVFHERHPKLVQQVLDALPYGPAERAAVEELLAESTTGLLRPLTDDGDDHELWLEWGRDVWGAPWGEAPFLWAESYFYRRLLAATGWFGPGAWRGVDPFAPFKDAELAGPAVDEELAALGELPGLAVEQRTEALLASSLWGNRADLSFGLTATPVEGRPAGLVADDSRLLLAAPDPAVRALVCLVADNAGRELLPDLVLVDHLLTEALAAEVVLYVKPYPYYVSDATMADVLATLRRLCSSPEPEAGRIGLRLRQAMTTGRLTVRTHPFFCAPLPYHEMPPDLRAEFAGAALTILKGDLNYRRLVGDRLWPAITPFAEVAGHFPSPVAALRTLKSDVVVGLDEQVVADLDAYGTPWRTSGTHALIQVHGTS